MQRHGTDSEHWTVLGYYRPVFNYLREQGEPLAPYLELLGIREEDLPDINLRIDNERITRVMELAEARCGDTNIGLHMGQTLLAQHLGIVGVLMMSCRRAQEVFDLHSRFQTLVGQGLATDYIEQGGQLCMQVMVPEGHPPMGRHEFEYSLAGWSHLREQIVGKDFQPLRAELPYPEPADDSEQRALFGSELSYGHDRVRVFFPLQYCDAPLLSADPELKQVLELQARKRLQALQGEQADTDPQLARVRQWIAEHLAYGPPSLEQIAEVMDVSVRTLQRRLDERDSSYKQLLDQVRSDLARKYIDNTELSLLDIAMMLGFAEQSSFARAFKRWFGDSPGAYRRQMMIDY